MTQVKSNTPKILLTAGIVKLSQKSFRALMSGFEWIGAYSQGGTHPFSDRSISTFGSSPFVQDIFRDISYENMDML